MYDYHCFKFVQNSSTTYSRESLRTCYHLRYPGVLSQQTPNQIRGETCLLSPHLRQQGCPGTSEARKGACPVMVHYLNLTAKYLLPSVQSQRVSPDLTFEKAFSGFIWDRGTAV